MTPRSQRPPLRRLHRLQRLRWLVGLLVVALLACVACAACAVGAATPANAVTQPTGGSNAGPVVSEAGPAGGVRQGCGVLASLCEKAGEALEKGVDAGKTAVKKATDCAEDGLEECTDAHVPDVPDPVRKAASAACAVSFLCAGASQAPKVVEKGKDAAERAAKGATEAAKKLPGKLKLPDPFKGVKNAIAKAVNEAWVSMMLAIWSAGLYILRLVLAFSEAFLTPDLSADGPGRDVYAFTLWLALALVVIMAMIQLGTAAFKRDGKSLARAFIGAGQFVLVCSCWFSYCVMIVAACGALTHALMKSLLKINTWNEWDLLSDYTPEDDVEAVVATVLAVLGIFLWIAAIGHLLVYLARAASLIMLTATGPVAAAGLASDATRSWFWKSLRWFHAAALTPVLMVLVLGIGVQLSNGVAAGLAGSTQKAIGTALPSVMLILISVVCPLALFKLLAFVDPGTPSGASFRQGMAAAGGVPGLLGGGGSGGSGGSSVASTADSNGRSAGEESAESSTGNRFSSKIAGGLDGGNNGGLFSNGLGMVQSLGANAAALMTDETNQAGVAHQSYGPDFGASRRSSGAQHPASDSSGDPDDTDDGGGDGPDGRPSPTPPPSPIPSTASPSVMPQPPGGGGSGSASKPPGGGGGTGGSGGAGGGAGAAGEIPPVV